MNTKQFLKQVATTLQLEDRGSINAPLEKVLQCIQSSSGYEAQVS